MSAENKEEYKMSSEGKAILILGTMVLILTICLIASVMSSGSVRAALETERSLKVDAERATSDLQNDYDSLHDAYNECVGRFTNNEERLIENVRKVKASNKEAEELQDEINAAAKKRDEEKERAKRAAKDGENIIRLIVTGTGSDASAQ